MSNFVADLLCQEIQIAFYCDDEKEIEITGNSKRGRCFLHKSLLCAISPMLRTLLKEESNFVIIVPDVEEILLQKFCEMVYFGHLKLDNSEQLENVNQVLGNLFALFGIKSMFVQENVESQIEDTASEIEVAPSQEDDFTPQIIKSEFSYDCTMKEHMKIHREITPYFCDICGKRWEFGK